MFTESFRIGYSFLACYSGSATACPMRLSIVLPDNIPGG